CVLIFVFLLITGAQPSIVRASLISILSLGAWYFGRNVKPLLLMCLTGTVTALWNPLYIWSDIGWYLSFLAFFGVLMVAPVIKARLFGEKSPGLVGELVIESFSAQVMTLPIILFIFGQSSHVVLLVNLLVVAIIPIGMVFSFIAGLAGIFASSFVGWFAWPARIILTYILDMATMVARIPGMQFSVQFGVVSMVFSYVLIVLVTYIWWQKLPKTVNITDKNYFE
ncbi:ComEC/Rec2 family competence protein, partial [Candidatus Saccharibacteria bacterium]|nr:ComEC/Rec2 family competence protein [Candidatus Saccharibacteria bacterium]